MANATRVAPNGQTITYDNNASFPVTRTVRNVTRGWMTEDVVLTGPTDQTIQAMTKEATPAPTGNAHVGDVIEGY